MIEKFIDERISAYNKNMIDMSRVFKLLSGIKYPDVVSSKAYTIIDIIRHETRDEVFDTSYGFDYSNIIKNKTFTNSEILRKIILKDYSRLYTTTIAYENTPLMFSKDVTEIFNIEKDVTSKKINEEEKDDTCETIIIAKL